tara:strand:- start:105 stop:476 length:372 start_codon:yes stop_codon:yes gene_type:complete
MTAHIVTKVTVRPNTSIAWPWDNSGVNGFSNIGDDVMTRVVTISADELTHTSVQTWVSKERFRRLVLDKNDSTFANAAATNRAYMAANNITCVSTQTAGSATTLDGRVGAFNSSNQTFELVEE